MSLDLTAAPPAPPTAPAHAAPAHAAPAHAAPAHAAPAAPGAADPPSRPAARHRRRGGLPELAERLWRPPLALAVAIFAACGPAHALGHPDLVFNAVLVALVLSSVSVPLGLLALRHVPDA
ncbi:hypothetical protein [Pseudosporangium ferrugineum]|uniref:Uncharacterized protein n=1 Tax=Pseudosporangium ferrugineum TaxID=439699 RepID=A0A2T0SFG9_9ACTN|nr:hypothetical protein [Pseudosporangium ferrugineum]PRY32166.1 hypothetical protein CLV70_102377 [Pseudosporangium ferrugineum]